MAMLEVKNLEVYYGVIQAIKGISFEVNEGEVIALIGANGAGKTTTLQTITGMLSLRRARLFLRDVISQRSRDTRSFPWEWRMCRRDVVYLQSCPYMKT